MIDPHLIDPVDEEFYDAEHGIDRRVVGGIQAVRYVTSEIDASAPPPAEEEPEPCRSS